MRKKVKNDLFDYENRFIYQYEEGFKFSLDSILLAEYVSNFKNKNVLDLCTGNCAIPLILTTKYPCQIDAVEIQKEVYELAKESIVLNKLEDEISVYNFDANDIFQKINKKYDIITCNPPYYKVDKTSLVNKEELLNIARHEIKFKLEDLFKIANQYLNDKGRLYLIHTISRLDEIIILGSKYNLNMKEIQLIRTSSKNKPSLVIVKALKNSKTGIIVNDIINIEKCKTYKNIFKERG